MIVRILRLPHNPDLPLPARCTSGAAGYDVASAEQDTVLAPGERRLFDTGFSLQLPEDVECQVRPRSGLALRYGVTLANAPATIDPDFRGELRILLWNSGAEPVSIPRGTRIAQLVFTRFLTPPLVETERLEPSERGAQGFGSTGL